MSELLNGYARCSTDDQDLTAQREALVALGVAPKRIYVDHGLTRTNRDRPGLREALAACRAGDTLVVATLDRLARSLPDARNIVDDLTQREVNGLPGHRARATATRDRHIASTEHRHLAPKVTTLVLTTSIETCSTLGNRERRGVATSAVCPSQKLVVIATLR